MRKGALAFTLSMLISLGSLLIVCVSIAGIVLYHVNIPIDSSKAEADMFVEMIMQEITKRYDVTDRIVPGVVDKEKFLNIEKIDWGYPNHLGARLTIGQNKTYVNKGLFQRTWPIAEAKIKKITRSWDKEEDHGLDYPVKWPEGAFRYKIPVGYEVDGISENQTLEIIVVMQVG